MFKGCYWLNLQSSFSHFRQVESSPTKLIRFLSAWIPFLIVDIPLQTCHGDSRFIQMQGERSDRKDMQWYCAGYILWGYKVRLGTQSEGHINWDWGETSSTLSYLLSLHVLGIVGDVKSILGSIEKIRGVTKNIVWNSQHKEAI